MDTLSKTKDVTDPLTLHMLDHDRQYKIRLVEKLGYMKSALGQDDASNFRRHLSKEHGSEDNVEWLDDSEVSKLSNAELESIMDKYIMTVVKQLVQLGSVDEDLRAEIDAVDSNGLSLLHYCCLYNLTSLIPVLVSRGADVNQVTNTGSSPLHLAVAAGHLLAAQVLLSNGANAHAVDGSGRGAMELARQTGNEEIHELLCRVSFTAKL
ncbi:hypothetical protein EON65_27100 [archaeon]|nr:MAG: hypothetical protein EON65_27100 [archaeon]